MEAALISEGVSPLQIHETIFLLSLKLKMTPKTPASDRKRSVVDESKLHVTSIFSKTGDHAIIDHVADADEEVLVSLGYKQEFKRDLTIWSSFSVSFSVLGLLPSIASTLTYNLGYSGPAGSVWGWIVAGILIQFVALAMAELCSSMPTAGGLYYASAVLAPEGWGPLCSWITGWSNFLGQVTGPCSVNYALSAMILTAAEIANPDYTAQTWHIYLVFLLLLIVEGLLTMNSTKFLGRLNEIGTILNLIALIVFVVSSSCSVTDTHFLSLLHHTAFMWHCRHHLNGKPISPGYACCDSECVLNWNEVDVSNVHNSKYH